MRHLTDSQVDEIFRKRLVELETLHLHARINEHVRAAMGEAEEWDPVRGEALLAALEAEWASARSGADGVKEQE